MTTPGGMSKNTAADDFTYVDVTQLSVTPMTVVVLNHYEETDPHLVWAGGWFSVANVNDSGGSVKRATQAASVTIKFSGERVSLVGETHPYGGYAKVTLDKSSPVTIDFYSAATLYKQLVWESGTLASGNHVVTMEWTGNAEPRLAGHHHQPGPCSRFGWEPAVGESQRLATTGRTGTDGNAPDMTPVLDRRPGTS